ncbi:hypothetical protein GCM10022222_79380 [Amycolatopsis ultiminotia]|uniref:Transcriptional regulator n=1 Tax=Amycolatopsis ultiminotia TaxID=543629 RepID=A0ABP6YH32_9PSEU
MTGQRTVGQKEVNARELGRLLETGPFDEALRVAIRARGLGLERIRYRLRSRGTAVSLATLSHWQSGRCRPERPESLQALENLEDILGLPGGVLRRLLGSPRPRGRHSG